MRFQNYCALYSMIMLLSAIIPVKSQVTGPEQDCQGAFHLCFPTFDQPLSYSGIGEVHDIFNSKCLQNDENNSTWFVFTASDSGVLQFTLFPKNSGPAGDDYDFSLFNITGGTCNDIANGTAEEVRCNYAFTNGPTGLQSGYSSTIAGPGDSAFLAPLVILPSETYALVIDNFSPSSNGYSLDFTRSSVNIVDSIPPRILSVETIPNLPESWLSIKFTEKVKCSTLQDNGNEFQVLDTSDHIIPITSVILPQCNNSALIDSIVISLTDSAIKAGTYKLIVIDQSYSDYCGLMAMADTVEFELVCNYRNISFSIPDSACIKTMVNISTDSNLVGWDLYWNFGNRFNSNQQNPSVSYSASGKYTIILKADTAGCTYLKQKQIIIGVCPGINETYQYLPLKIIPNPNNGSFTIKKTGQNIEKLTINFFTIQGKSLFEDELSLTNSNPYQQYELNSLTPGIYFLKAQTADRITVEKIVIQ